MSGITIGLMTVEDVDAVHAIEEACFKTPWSKASFLREVTENACARYMVVREDGVAIAYAGVWFVLDEGHITNIAVHPDKRGMGYGEMVTRALIQMAALYVDYLGIYLLNGWLPIRSIGYFTVIFVIGFGIIWAIIYLSTRIAVERINSQLNK